MDTNENECLEIIEDMRSFNDQNPPSVGFFWYDPKTNELFGVQSIGANQTSFNNGRRTLRKTHREYWQKEKHRSSKDRRIQGDYTMTPRGRVYQFQDGSFKVYVGSWITKYLHKVEKLVKEEFNINEFNFVIEKHWEIGTGWDGD